MPQNSPDPGARVIDALSEVAGALIDDRHDVGAALFRISTLGVELLSAAAVGIMVVDPRGGVGVVAASDERARLVELLQTQYGSGPCPQCIRTGEMLAVPDLTVDPDRWPEFAAVARDLGYRAILAVPMVLDGRTIGGLNVLYTRPTDFDRDDHRLASLLAALIVLELTQETGDQRADRLAERTLGLLNDRVHAGHATGFVAGTLDVSPARARGLLDDYSRRHAIPLRELARRITDGTLHPIELTETDAIETE
ncbi:GAF domain-containing protein [Rhodococcus koreensis]|uniref:GAF domain-containing protein n=1 Tax=Rhodococcus koreensis TaxID=99653 RepID=UPI001981D7BA|nr:GAF domain-containing protein [Rhodococcus koreensis]QSE86864.1 GAF and ANTAR domain-containing protein [Rhodococcus koreensis]